MNLVKYEIVTRNPVRIRLRWANWKKKKVDDFKVGEDASN